MTTELLQEILQLDYNAVLKSVQDLNDDDRLHLERVAEHFTEALRETETVEIY